MTSNIFIFTNDLRTTDNTAWTLATENTKYKTIPVVLLPRSFVNKRVKKFYMESVKDLESQLTTKLIITTSLDAVPTRTRTNEPVTVYYNRDPIDSTPDSKIQKWCKKHSLQLIAPHTDYSLLDFEKLPRPFKVFSNFYKTFGQVQVSVNKVSKVKARVYEIVGGRTNALAILNTINQNKFAHYSETRDQISSPTTMLSAYMNCGCVSVREVWHAFKNNEPLLRQLFWREFYQQLVFFFPNLKKGAAFYPQRDLATWSRTLPKAWVNGTTGVPLVDASMRHLKRTGYLHNRCRMVVASYLVKDMGVDWRLGEAYFKSQLTDYYFPSNNGGWQFISGTGASAMMQSRRFNPLIQAAKYDPKSEFIKQYMSSRK